MLPAEKRPPHRPIVSLDAPLAPLGRGLSREVGAEGRRAEGMGAEGVDDGSGSATCGTQGDLCAGLEGLANLGEGEERMGRVEGDGRREGKERIGRVEGDCGRE